MACAVLLAVLEEPASLLTVPFSAIPFNGLGFFLADTLEETDDTGVCINSRDAGDDSFDRGRSSFEAALFVERLMFFLADVLPNTTTLEETDDTGICINSRDAGDDSSDRGRSSFKGALVVDGLMFFVADLLPNTFTLEETDDTGIRTNSSDTADNFFGRCSSPKTTTFAETGDTGIWRNLVASSSVLGRG